jgi:methylated-DNA-[protein]-cysteine S-methyltransferase
MRCGEFNQQVDAVLAGDVAESELSTGAVGEHLGRCASCSGTWNHMRSLLEVIPVPESDRDVEAAVARAREHLRAAFSRIGRPVVRFDVLRTPIGRVFVGMSDQGVCDVTLDDPDERDYRLRLARHAPEVLRDRDVVELAATELEAYFQGRLSTFTVPVDLRGVTDFTRRVLRATRRIPFGTLLSYGDVASRIGSPRASRAVGGALGRNPVPIIVPCHRVIAHGGKLGGFTGGLDMKRTLLQIEGHTPADGFFEVW